MANLKNITELPVAESAEGLNLIVNDNGTAKQIAASKVGTSSWNDLKDKPFYSETDEDGNETVHKLDAKYLPNSGGYSFAFKNARYKSSNTYYFVDKGLYDAIKRGEAPPGVFTEFDEESSNMLNLFTPRYYLVDEFIGGISVILMLGSEVSSRQVFICDTDEHAFDHYDR